MFTLTYFFPGGHVEFGEKITAALGRELKEELDISIKRLEFIGGVDNIFVEGKEKHHEVNIVFDVSVESMKQKSQEDHIDFYFFGEKEFFQKKVLPLVLQKSVVQWLRDRKIFWASQNV